MTPVLFSLAAAITTPAPQMPPPPPYRPPQRLFVGWSMGDVYCGQAGVPVAHRVEPSLVQSYGDPAADPATVTLSFRIDAAGRPLGIRRDAAAYVADSSDIAPSLAATRFAAGVARDECRIVYTARRSPLAEASLADVRAFAIAPNVRPDAEMFRRTFPTGSDCFSPSPEVRLRGFPPFDKLRGSPGELSWSMTQFDIDKGGRPIGMKTVAGTGDAALDQASRRAVAESRFAPGVRHGCVYPYYRRPATLAAPVSPDMESLRPASATCPRDTRWTTNPVLVFPSAYNRRSIEGWAIVAFDVAPWGATGNVRVLAAEPSADFGESATNVIRAATQATSASGYSGCIERVVFKIAPSGKAPPTAGSPVPPVPPPIY